MSTEDRPPLCPICAEPMRSYVVYGVCEDCHFAGRKAEALAGNESPMLKRQPRNLLEAANGEEFTARILRAIDQIENES
jgi:hypothetical protein